MSFSQKERSMGMERIKEQNMERIRAIFRARTGVELPRKSRRPLWRGALGLAAAMGALFMVCSLSVLGYSMFSAVDSESLGFRAFYLGEGKFNIYVGNASDKELVFQEKLKLMRWSTAQEVEGKPEKALFEGMRIAAHTEGILRVDLSSAYDIRLLEQGLGEGDWYYLVLTNNNFVFGQDWMCDVDFTQVRRDMADQEVAESYIGQMVLPGVQELQDHRADAEEEAHYPAAQGLLYGDWIWPVSRREVSASFGVHQNGIFSDHISIPGEQGEAVLAVTDGTIAETGYERGAGNYVILRDENGVEIKYGHLKEILVEAGQQVYGGDQVGALGKTGMATGPNLLLAVYVEGEAVDPLGGEGMGATLPER